MSVTETGKELQEIIIFKVSSVIRNSRILEFWNFLVGFMTAGTASLLQHVSPGPCAAPHRVATCGANE